MRIVPVLTTPQQANSDEVRRVFLDRTVTCAGVATFPPGFYAHPGEVHKHEHDEVFVILSGEITVPITGGPTGIARAGDWVLVEAGEEHHLTNHTTLPCMAMYIIMRKPGA